MGTRTDCLGPRPMLLEGKDGRNVTVDEIDSMHDKTPSVISLTDYDTEESDEDDIEIDIDFEDETDEDTVDVLSATEEESLKTNSESGNRQKDGATEVKVEKSQNETSRFLPPQTPGICRKQFQERNKNCSVITPKPEPTAPKPLELMHNSLSEGNELVVDGHLQDYTREGTCGYEPVWASSVGEKGDLFYIQPSLQGRPRSVSQTQQNGSLPADDLDDSQSQRSNHKGKVKNMDLNNKRHDVKVVRTNSGSSSTNGYSSGNKVTFNDNPTGVTRQVTLLVDPHRHNYGRRASLCESVFGVIPGFFTMRPEDENGQCSDKRIMIQGLLPGGEACRSGLKIGEWLMAVNDVEVDFDSIDDILITINSVQEVKLTLQKIAIQTSPKAALLRKNGATNHELVQLLSGERLHEEPLPIDKLVHGAFFLTLDCHSESMKGKEDIVYQYPDDDKKLTDIRGAFITLAHMMVDVTNNTAKSSTLLVDGQLTHVGYSKENREVLMLAVPALRVSLSQLNYIMSDLVRLLKVMYGSLHNAFSIVGHHDHLHRLLSLVLHCRLQGPELIKRGVYQSAFHEPFLECLPGIRTLSMPEEVKVTMNNCLGDFEAQDFADMSEDYYDLRRSYVILGSSLFYKGYMLANHLHCEDVRDIQLYLQLHCLLTLCNEEQLGQLVVWREVFPTRRCHRHADPITPGFTEPEARWFLMVVGMRNAVLGVLLEAGGCAAWAEGCPTPDPFYVDQARSTILQMEALDVFNQCEIRLQGPCMPSLAGPDWFQPQGKGSRDEGIGRTAPSPSLMAAQRIGQPESILKKRTGASPMEGQRHGRGAVYDVDSDVDSLSTGTSEGSTPMPDRHSRKTSVGSEGSEESQGSSGLFKGSRRRRNLLSVFDLTELKRGLMGDPGQQDDTGGTLVKLSSGCDNTLFHYINLEGLDGVILCPTQQELQQFNSDLHSQVMTQFHHASLAIREVLTHSDRAQAVAEQGNRGKFGTDTSLGQVVEHGILFHCPTPHSADPKKPTPPLTYWVIGRIIREPFPREFYVCFQDSAQQNLIEMAFKLSYGLIV